MMECDRCRQRIEEGEEREINGRILCEDCYMDFLSPSRTCDPWAVHSAKSFMKVSGKPRVNETQAKILEIIGETGGAERSTLCERLQIGPSELERAVASLRHMEMVRGELREDKKVFLVLW